MPDANPLVPGAPVLIAGGRVTGRAVLAALTRSATPTVCDDDPAMLRPYADGGVATVDPAVAEQRITSLRLCAGGYQSRLSADDARAGGGRGGRCAHLGRCGVGLAAGRRGSLRAAAALVGGHRHQRQYDDDIDAARHVDDRRMRSVLCGNIGSPVLDVLDQPTELLAVELPSFQLHWAPSLRPEAGVVLNIAEDHLDWHSSMAEYSAAKARVLNGRVAVVGLDDRRAAALLESALAPVRVGFRLGEPAAGELGVQDGQLVDRAFADGLVLMPAASIPVPGPSGVLDTLAAAALARCVGVAADAIADAIGSFRLGRHRAEVVAVADSITYVDDSKATNPHAAEASCWPTRGWFGWPVVC